MNRPHISFGYLARLASSSRRTARIEHDHRFGLSVAVQVTEAYLIGQGVALYLGVFRLDVESDPKRWLRWVVQIGIGCKYAVPVEVMQVEWLPLISLLAQRVVVMVDNEFPPLLGYGLSFRQAERPSLLSLHEGTAEPRQP